MPAIGSRKQETKIREMAEITLEFFPYLNEGAVRGAFRFGANEALEEKHYNSWREVVDQTKKERKEFFELLLGKAFKSLRTLIRKEDLNKKDKLIRKIKSKNEEYVEE